MSILKSVSARMIYTDSSLFPDQKDGSYYVNLSLKTAMIRYVNDRFVDVELVVSEKPV